MGAAGVFTRAVHNGNLHMVVWFQLTKRVILSPYVGQCAAFSAWGVVAALFDNNKTTI